MKELFERAKKLIEESKNIYILLQEKDDSESVPIALALFYILKKIKKNVNLIVEELPKRFQFLIPSLDFISYPRDFIISVPDPKAPISQVRYEKNAENLKIYLTLDKGNIKKNDISFYFEPTKPDLLITLGIKGRDYFLNKNAFNFEGNFTKDLPILNIDNQSENENFGRVNLVEPDCSFSELVTNFIKSIAENLIEKEIATCLLAGLVIFSENFQSQKISPKIFEMAGFLMQKGASYQNIINNLYKSNSLNQGQFLNQIFQNLNFDQQNNISWAVLDSLDFRNFGDFEIGFTIEQLKNNFLIPSNLLVLWPSHASGPLIKGFLYSEKTDLIKKIFDLYQGNIKNNSIFFSVENLDISFIKDKILKTLIS